MPFVPHFLVFSAAHKMFSFMWVHAPILGFAVFVSKWALSSPLMFQKRLVCHLARHFFCHSRKPCFLSHITSMQQLFLCWVLMKQCNQLMWATTSWTVHGHISVQSPQLSNGHTIIHHHSSPLTWDCFYGDLAQSWDLAFNLSAKGPPPPASPSLSPQGNALRSWSDFAVMELQDKLDLMIDPYRGAYWRFWVYPLCLLFQP